MKNKSRPTLVSQNTEIKTTEDNVSSFNATLRDGSTGR